MRGGWPFGVQQRVPTDRVVPHGITWSVVSVLLLSETSCFLNSYITSSVSL